MPRHVLLLVVVSLLGGPLALDARETRHVGQRISPGVVRGSDEQAYCAVLATARAEKDLESPVGVLVREWPRKRLVALLDESTHLPNTVVLDGDRRAPAARSIDQFCRSNAVLAPLPTDRILKLAAYVHARAARYAWEKDQDTELLALHLDVMCEWLDRLAPLDRPPAFQRDLLIDTVRYLHFSVDSRHAEDFAGRARERLPDEPLIALAAGAVLESAALHERSSASGSAAARLKSALDLYEHTLAQLPGLDDARLRHARVLVCLGRAREAVPALRSLATTARTPECRYLARLFLGQAQEALGDPRTAENSYRTASTQPGARAPWFALASLALQAGDPRTAHAALARAVPQSAEERPDPWWAYEFGDCSVFEPLARRLDEAVLR